MARAVATRGYSATSVANVIELAGVSRTTFYEHFANKDECFLAAYEVMVYRMLKNVRGAQRQSEDPRDALELPSGRSPEKSRSSLTQPAW